MNFIIWTIGWFLVATLEEFIYDKMSDKRNESISSIWRGMKFGIWVIGMVKFW